MALGDEVRNQVGRVLRPIGHAFLAIAALASIPVVFSRFAEAQSESAALNTWGSVMLTSFMAAMMCFSLRSLLAGETYLETTRGKLAIGFSIVGVLFLATALVGSLRVVYSRFFAAENHETIWQSWSGVVFGGVMLWLASWIIAGWLNKDAGEWSD